jgi:hypothetical protein
MDNQEKFEYIHNEEVGNGQFYIAKLPERELLFVFLDKYGYFNIFPTMQDYTLYVENDLTCKRDCIEDSYIEEGEEGYEEGVDALDRYLRELSEPIGAYCDIRYLDDGSEGNKYYFSFVGLGGEDDEKDAAGIPDNEIFFFADGGEEEIKNLMKEPSPGCMNDFLILDYKLRYKHLEFDD